MNKFNDLYRIESTRLKNWDYSSSGWYFVTICTYKQELRFGEIIDGEMKLFKIGAIAKQELLKTPLIRKNIELDEWTIMPNHIHVIFTINYDHHFTLGVETRRGVSLQPQFGLLISQSLGSIINHFKGSVTKYANVNNIPFTWQANYHDHIIRNERELSTIREYIKANPANWARDRNYR